MNGQRKCEGCRQRHDCRDIYGELGGADSASVTLGVVVAFLAPIVIFIVCLSAVEGAAGFGCGGDACVGIGCGEDKQADQ
jgi:hypothetical protein